MRRRRAPVATPERDASALSRRRFLSLGAAGVGITAVPASLVAGSGRAAAAPDPLTFAAWSGLVGTEVTIERWDGPALTTRLASVIDERRATTSGGEELVGEAFTLVLEAPGAPMLDGGTYQVGHRALGSAPMLVSPLDDRPTYAVCVNTRLPATEGTD
ncbi:MAG: hypothetical protein OEY23_18045 [Acidimicrobiia bacterium]|nr:hypothetical protein [Acidimicrobiia bacterium]